MPVYLMGAGPGDPGLITVKGAEILKQADAVVYDRLAQFSGGILDLAPPDAEKIYVGKTPAKPRFEQKEINDLLIELAQKHAIVVRLKGGDPFVFARGGEEADALAKAGVEFEIIPGISASIAVPAYAGIPVTLRHSSTSFTVITGHEDPSTAESIDWASAARLGGTLIILMGAKRWQPIAEKLLAANMDPDTPAAAIRWGTRPDQTTIRATLQTLGDHILEAPLTIVLGKVAAENLEWFEKLPLFGKKILITRAAGQGAAMVQGIFNKGGDPVQIPLIEIVPQPMQESPKESNKEPKTKIGQEKKSKQKSKQKSGQENISQALQGLLPGDWLVCTSANGVRQLFSSIPDARILGGIQIAAIGSATAAAFQAGNIQPDLVPDSFVAEALLEAFPPPEKKGQKALLFRAESGRDVLPEGLKQKGYEVLDCSVYSTHSLTPSPEQLKIIESCAVVTFASPSAVKSYQDLTKGRAGIKPPKITACIGPVTAKAAKEAGFAPEIIANTHTSEGLIEAIADYFCRPAL